MHLSTLEEYGVRCALQLAKNGAENGMHPVQVPGLAQLEGLSIDYTAKIMQIFKKEGLVISIRGHQGGFSLQNSASGISLKSVLNCLQSKKYQADDFCRLYPGDQKECVHKQECSIRPVWMMLFTYFDEFLASITLEDLMTKEKESKEFVESVAKKQCEKAIRKIAKIDA